MASSVPTRPSGIRQGLDADYVSELQGIFTVLYYASLGQFNGRASHSETGRKATFANLAPLPHYGERYTSAAEESEEKAASRRRIQRIDELVDEINDQRVHHRVRGAEERAAYLALAGRIYFHLKGSYHASMPKEALAYSFKDHALPKPRGKP
jgi:hypothetical protein